MILARGALKSKGTVVYRSVAFINMSTPPQILRSTFKRALQYGHKVVFDAEDDPRCNVVNLLDQVYTGMFEGLVNKQAVSKEGFIKLMTATGKEMFGAPEIADQFSFIWLQRSALLPFWVSEDTS